MLDTETKRRIDTARDILVGKVPDPKSQVEQITIALIYKFMDDMDAKSEEFGGERQFFAGEFAQYGWASLMHGGLSGHDVLNLYATAIARMPENPGIPTLFRDIFNNAYLPYRDPETLRAFLKVIDEFTYDHSERLGDAFEYLLSVLGSQGDAGQFRTPRHIIDFIVSIIDPKKNETVLDPACGTAGFLISSWKHIEKAETDEKGNSTLTPDDKGILAQNFSGYDISPDMVRLSLVNMYLHGFAQPRIHEYDTLTSEDRWNEFADVILANPPFMSPKGGIRPHNRFSVISKRSEVLFVDYMAEHLTPEGRAGIIVPEGIIFQSQNAHRQLRRKLVEDYLVAVVSLPAGVFNPYSGVKTSILILDRKLAKQTDHIAFFKVENDGFDLGAQRREIEMNDLPMVREEICQYLTNLQSGDSDYFEVSFSDSWAEHGVEYKQDKSKNTTGLIVEKVRIAADGEYSLSGEQYREINRVDSVFPYVSLDTVAKVFAGNPAPQGSEYFENGEVPFIRTSDVGAVHRTDSFHGAADKVNRKAIEELRLRLSPPGTILFPKSGASTFLNHRVITSEAAYVSSHLAGIVCDKQKALTKYVYHLLCQMDARDITPEQAYPSLRLKEIGGIQIPLPPLEVQREIVEEIEGYQRVIDGAQTVIENYKPSIEVDPEWPKSKLGDICDVRDGTHDSPKYIANGYPLITSKNLRNGHIDFKNVSYISRSDLDSINRRSKVDFGDILMPMIGTVGYPVIADSTQEFAVKNVAIIKFRQDSNVDREFLHIMLASEEMQFHFDKQSRGSTQRFLSLGFLRKLDIALPSLSVQEAIVKEIRSEQALIESNRELVQLFNKKKLNSIGRVLG